MVDVTNDGFIQIDSSDRLASQENPSTLADLTGVCFGLEIASAKATGIVGGSTTGNRGTVRWPVELEFSYCEPNFTGATDYKEFLYILGKGNMDIEVLI